MRCSFFLGQYTDSYNERTLFIRVAFGGIKIPFKRSLEIKLTPEDWDHENQEVRKSHSLSKIHNLNLKEKKQQVQEFFARCALDGISEKQITKEDVLFLFLTEEEKLELERKEKEKKTPVLVSLINPYIEYKSTHLAKGSIANLIGILDHLKEFIQTFPQTVTITDTDEKFLQSYFEYLLTLGNANSTVKNQLGGTKNFLNWAAKQTKQYANKGYKDFEIPRTFKTFTDSGFAFELEEFSKLKETKLLSDELQNYSKSIIFGCYTGLRVSELLMLNSKRILKMPVKSTKLRKKIERDFMYAVETVADKTNKVVLVPLLPQAETIALEFLGKKYETLFGVYNSKITLKRNEAIFNLQMQKVCKLAGLNRPVVQRKLVNKTMLETHTTVCDSVTSHTMRKTFVTLGSEFGIPEKILQNFTAHSTTKQLRTYNRSTMHTSAEALLLGWDEGESEGEE